MLNPLDYLWVALAALAAGTINSLAGGGTLLTFPVLVAVGLPTISANVTNSIALCPGFVGGTLAQAKDLEGQKRRLWLIIPAALLGGLIGGWLLLNSGEKLFRDLVPYLILIAAGLLAAQDPLRAWLMRRAQQRGHHTLPDTWVVLPVLLAAVYGGYFGAGMSVIILAILGLVLDDTLTRLNAIKQTVGFSANFAASLFFIFSGQVNWSVALVMAVAALLGGALGGKLAGKVQPAILRWIVVGVGVIVGLIYLFRGRRASPRPPGQPTYRR